VACKIFDDCHWHLPFRIVLMMKKSQRQEVITMTDVTVPSDPPSPAQRSETNRGTGREPRNRDDSRINRRFPKTRTDYGGKIPRKTGWVH